jgi:hypothetical protein
MLRRKIDCARRLHNGSLKRDYQRMSPPTEQLIRDYLNRLSVAARGQLNAEDRRELVARTRDFIERNSSRSGPATSMQVAALLARLGDPAGLVSQELARLAAIRGEPAPDSSSGKNHGLLRRRHAQASWHWPSASGSPDLLTRLLNGDEAGTGQSSGQGAAKEPPIWVPSQPDRPGLVAARSDAQPAESSPGRPIWPSLGAGSRMPQAEPAAPAGDAAGPTTQAMAEPDDGAPGEPGRAPALRSAAARGSALIGRAMKRPLESIAVTLLGVGGAIFPPVWLLGAGVTLGSRQWDYRDKWIGLAGPVMLLVIGIAAGVSMTAPHSSFGTYVHQGWLYADVVSRVAAILGASYLVWRVTHARRAPDVPPWNRPHKVG